MISGPILEAVRLGVDEWLQPHILFLVACALLAAFAPPPDPEPEEWWL